MGLRAIYWTLPVVVVALVAALPSGGQETGGEAPTSLLPEGPTEPAQPAAAKASPDDIGGALLPSPSAAKTASTDAPDAFALPEATGRDITVSGPLTLALGGYGQGLFAGTNGRFAAGLLRRMDLPVASRWMHITLRRALLSESTAPAGIPAADWIAARAWALTRMGEVDGAKLLVDAVPIDRYSPALYRIASLSSYAAGDIGGVCPLATTGQTLSRDSIWRLSVAMCGALQGDDLTSARVIDELRRDKGVDPFDVRMAERVSAVAGGGGRAANIPWDEAPPLTIYRWGVATAAGVPIPAERLEALGPARFGWIVRSAAVTSEVRAAALRPAAALGVISGSELASGLAATGQGDDSASAAGRLRTASAAASTGDRLKALRAIWESGGDDGYYGALIESAWAAARLTPSRDAGSDADDIIAALMATGADDAAGRWWGVAKDADAATRASAWAVLATGARSGIEVSARAFADWQSGAGKDATPHRAGLLLAGLDGLGRARGGDWDKLRGALLVDTPDSWTRAIDTAAAAGRQGEVVVLAATGMQGRWADVVPGHFRHLIAALVRVGRGHEARMIAAEAATRA